MSDSERKRQRENRAGERGRERKRGREEKKRKMGFCDLQDVYKETFKEQKLQIHGGKLGA